MSTPKYICLCCFGQLRNGRFMMDNHKYYLIDYFSKLGYIIHLYILCDLTDTSRINANVNTKITNTRITAKRNKNDIYMYLNKLKNKNVEHYEICIDERDKTKDDINSTNYIEQYIKYYNCLKMIKTEINYDIIIRYRFDTFFLSYPNIPNDHEFIETKHNTINYCFDFIQIFKGKYLQNLINQFEVINFKEFSYNLNNFNILPEYFIIDLFKKSNMSLVSQNNLCCVFRKYYGCPYFKGINWEYYDDHINIEDPPYNIDKIHILRNKIKEKKNNSELVILNINNKNNDSLYLYDFVGNNEPIHHQQLMISAFTADKIICNNNHYLYNFVNTEFSEKLISF